MPAEGVAAAADDGGRGFTRAVFGLLGVVFGAVLFIIVVGEWLGLFETLTERVAMRKLCEALAPIRTRSGTMYE